MTTPAIASFTRWLTVAVYFAIVLIPVVLLGHDGPWFGAGDLAIRGKAPTFLYLWQPDPTLARPGAR